jgi:single-strand DNA-binding protein
MISYNRVILTGKIANPLRRQYRPDGSPVVQFMLELNHIGKPSGQSPNHGSSGQALHHPDGGQVGGGLINVVAFGKLAEFKPDIFQAGQHLLVVGRLNQRRWQTPEGRHRTLTEVIATGFRRLEETSHTTDSTERGDKDEETH